MSEAMQKQLYGVGIFEEEIVLSDFTSGAEKRFVVSPEQLAEFFRHPTTFRPFPGLIWQKSDGKSDVFLVILPAKERTITYRPSKKRKGLKQGLADYRMRMPALAVQASVDVSTRKIISIQIWGFFGRTLEPETELYELPLPNLSRSSLCLGSAAKAKVNGDVIAAIETTVFDTPFNHHNHMVGVKKVPFEEYVRQHKGKCPVATLARIGKGRDILGGI